MTIRKFGGGIADRIFILLVAFCLISIRLGLNLNERYLSLIIGLLVILATIFLVSLITANPVPGLQDATHSVATDLSRLTQAATGLAKGNLSQTVQIRTLPLEIKTKDELGNLARGFSQMMARLKETKLRS